jgi:hypothetical protein
MTARRRDRPRDEHRQPEQGAGQRDAQRRGRTTLAQGQRERPDQQQARDGGQHAGGLGREQPARRGARQLDGLGRVQRFALHGPPISRSIRRLSRSWTLRRARQERTMSAASARATPVVSGRGSTNTG